MARQSGADAVHPGYGFLAENEDFARACRDAGLTFIGPTAEAIELMGSKTAARQAAVAAGVPVVPGTDTPLGDDVSDDEVRRIADGIGYPLMLKAVAGGGGKGMRMVAASRRTGQRAAGGALGGRVGLRRFGGLPRAPVAAPAPHRGAAARRSARHGGARSSSASARSSAGTRR